MTDNASAETTTETSTSTAAKKTSQPLTPGRAAARKRPTDRRPKATTQAPPAASQRSREVVDMSVQRDTVDVGFDFRPIPVRMGPGDEHVWNFNPDPDPEMWHAVEQAVEGWQNRKAEDVTLEEASETVEKIRVALADLLYNEDDKAAFVAEKRYGPFGLAKLAKSLMEEVTGFPTTL